MPTNEEIFISYSHDSIEHIHLVLELSNRLRSEGLDCILDQYEESPPEGWPRWMDKNIRNCKYVVLICTQSYYERVMGDEKEGKGLGVRWEGNLIYQHFYNAGGINQRFIPVILNHNHRQFIPTPLQGATYYSLEDTNGYDDLYLRLTGQPKVLKPELGKRRPLPKRVVKTDPAMFLSMPIDVELWNMAKWSATFFSYQADKPPVLGLAFRNESAARKIFEGWHERYGDNDRYEELRVSIIEGAIKGEEDGYTVQIGPDPDAAIKRFKDAGYAFDEDILMCISRINRMNPPSDSKNLSLFKAAYAKHKTYFLAPGIISEDGKQLKPLFEFNIFKSKVLFRHVSEISKTDIDSVAINTGGIERENNPFSMKK
jgi:TIR domain